ncbi:MAG: polysaccharide biosynthesis protein [Candidatus Methanoperedens sp.]
MNLFKNKKILVTGGTGSLGKELVWDLLKNHEPSIVRIYDVDETEQFNFQHELRYYFKDNLKKYEDTVRFLLGDVRDKERLDRAAENIDIIFHTAALKHVMACEYNSSVISNLSNTGL